MDKVIIVLVESEVKTACQLVITKDEYMFQL